MSFSYETFAGNQRHENEYVNTFLVTTYLKIVAEITFPHRGKNVINKWDGKEKKKEIKKEKKKTAWW